MFSSTISALNYPAPTDVLFPNVSMKFSSYSINAYAELFHGALQIRAPVCLRFPPSISSTVFTKLHLCVRQSVATLMGFNININCLLLLSFTRTSPTGEPWLVTDSLLGFVIYQCRKWSFLACTVSRWLIYADQAARSMQCQCQELVEEFCTYYYGNGLVVTTTHQTTFIVSCQFGKWYPHCQIHTQEATHCVGIPLIHSCHAVSFDYSRVFQW